MNNSKIAVDNIFLVNDELPNIVPQLRERETALVELIDALDHIRASSYWKVIARQFVDEYQKLVSQLKRENDTTVIFRLQGQITRAEKLDLDKTAEQYRKELQGIRKQLRDYA